MSDADVVVVRRYSSAVEAQVAQLVLEANGVPVVLLRDDAGGMLPSMHVLFPARLAVRRDDLELARRLLDEEVRAAGDARHEEDSAAGHESREDDAFLDQDDESGDDELP